MLRKCRGAAGIGLGTTIKYLRCTTSGAAGIGLGTTIKYMRRSTSGAAGNGLCTAIKYLRGAVGMGLGTTIKHLRCTTSAAANNSLGTTIKYLVNQNAGAETGPRPTYRVDRNLALYQARGAQQDCFFRSLPFRNKLDGGKPSCIWGQKCETGLSAVSQSPCRPLALIPINGKKNEIGGKIRTEK